MNKHSIYKINILAFVLVIALLPACSSTTFINPEKEYINAKNLTTVHFTKNIDVINAQEPKTYKRTIRNWSIKHYHYKLRRIVDIFNSALSDEIRDRGGVVNSLAKNKIHVKIKKIRVSLPVAGSLTFSSKMSVTLSIQFNDEGLFEIEGQYSELFMAEEKERRLEVLLNKSLKDALVKLINHDRFKEHLR